MSLFPHCSFRDKLYIISSQKAYEKFITNPRTYLLPPMPRPPCRVSIIGPPQAGKSTMCKLLAQHYNVMVLDVDTLIQPILAKFDKERLDKIKEEATQDAIEKIKMGINSGKLKYLSSLQMPYSIKQYSLVVINVIIIHLIDNLTFFLIRWNRCNRR